MVVVGGSSEVYDIMGRLRGTTLDNDMPNSLPAGIYVLKNGGQTRKVIVK